MSLPTNFLSLPLDVQIFIIESLSSQELINLCTANREYQRLCQQEAFWQRLVQRKLGPVTPIGGSWFTTYVMSLPKVVYVVSESIFGPRDYDLHLYTYDSREKTLQHIVQAVIDNQKLQGSWEEDLLDLNASDEFKEYLLTFEDQTNLQDQPGFIERLREEIIETLDEEKGVLLQGGEVTLAIHRQVVE